MDDGNRDQDEGRDYGDDNREDDGEDGGDDRHVALGQRLLICTCQSRHVRSMSLSSQVFSLDKTMVERVQLRQDHD